MRKPPIRPLRIRDGKLTYGREKILESYYNVHIWRGLYFAELLQFVNNPGYNRDRRPAIIPGSRLHVEL